MKSTERDACTEGVGGPEPTTVLSQIIELASLGLSLSQVAAILGDIDTLSRWLGSYDTLERAIAVGREVFCRKIIRCVAAAAEWGNCDAVAWLDKATRESPGRLAALSGKLRKQIITQRMLDAAATVVRDNVRRSGRRYATNARQRQPDGSACDSR